MSSTVQDELAALRGIEQLEEIKDLAGRRVAPLTRPKSNLHVHLPPNFSAFETVEQVVKLAAEQQIGVLGVSNYYDYEIYAEYSALCRKNKIFPVFGLEIIGLSDQLCRQGVKVNDPGNPGKYYMVGKGITRFSPMSAEAQRLVGVIRRNDSQRMAQMTALIAQIFESRGLPLDVNEDSVKDMVMQRHRCPRQNVYLQERHIAQAFQEALFERVPSDQRGAALAKVLGLPPSNNGSVDKVKVQGDIRSHLMKAGKPAFVEESFIQIENAYRLILEMGGIPAYPTLADGTKPICGYEDPVEQLIERLSASRIYCAELIPIRNQPAMLSHYVKSMRRAGLVVTAGTEHNTLDMLALDPACVNAQEIPEDVKEIFWEGTCVIVAHQFLCLHGKCGFVDAAGRPNPEYKSDEQRISAFRELGAAVLARYYQS
ncbi:MAG TPA: hypothetical protein VGP72_18250 [Planctomycetota bacterium]